MSTPEAREGLALAGTGIVGPVVVGVGLELVEEGVAQ